METVEIFNKLKQSVQGILEKGRFGRSSTQVFWVESRSIAKAAEYLKNQPGIQLDWLENLSAIQMDDALVLSYFVRSSTQSHSVILRSSVVPGSQTKEVDLASVCGAWKMAEPFEVEIQDLFGIRFLDSKGQQAHPSNQKLPKGWNGFPLRKNYVFPTQFYGISHTRRTDTGGNA